MGRGNSACKGLGIRKADIRREGAGAGQAPLQKEVHGPPLPHLIPLPPSAEGSGGSALETLGVSSSCPPSPALPPPPTVCQHKAEASFPPSLGILPGSLSLHQLVLLPLMSSPLHVLCASHSGLLAVPGTPQACSHLRAFALPLPLPRMLFPDNSMAPSHTPLLSEVLPSPHLSGSLCPPPASPSYQCFF